MRTTALSYHNVHRDDIEVIAEEVRRRSRQARSSVEVHLDMGGDVYITPTHSAYKRLPDSFLVGTYTSKHAAEFIEDDLLEMNKINLRNAA
ncbi:hypothetical protein [Pseudoxanthomonas sp.]|uniref:hypothetical protein n=1 Tax=Pseudoxanthomonas sp. TaxID=1871049 RepID=UPI0026372F9C|nr:hypothetical protein [Pseudoxanthomonas sp.]WDS36196.1 MAG: hypothetical protein O8I58_18325 [Pseudoxanthomonas sp.]